MHNGVVSHGQGRVGWTTSTMPDGKNCTKEIQEKIYVQKHTTPVDIRHTARNIKTGPAAPVIASPARSIHLKQRKTCFAQIIDFDEPRKAPYACQNDSAGQAKGGGCG